MTDIEFYTPTDPAQIKSECCPNCKLVKNKICNGPISIFPATGSRISISNKDDKAGAPIDAVILVLVPQMNCRKKLGFAQVDSMTVWP